LTRTQQSENRTATAEVIGATRTQQADDRTATMDARTTTAVFKARYLTIPRGELINYADRHVGEDIKVQGRVMNIIDDKTIQIYLEGSWDTVLISSVDPVNVYKNDWITAYGTIYGFYSGKNGMGVEMKWPLLTAATIIGPKH
jgi:hypothetical protein